MRRFNDIYAIIQVMPKADYRNCRLAVREYVKYGNNALLKVMSEKVGLTVQELIYWELHPEKLMKN